MLKRKLLVIVGFLVFLSINVMTVLAAWQIDEFDSYWNISYNSSDATAVVNNFAYALNVTGNGTASNYVDTSSTGTDSGSDCFGMRITDDSNNTLEYYIVNASDPIYGCDKTSTDIRVKHNISNGVTNNVAMIYGKNNTPVADGSSASGDVHSVSLALPIATYDGENLWDKSGNNIKWNATGNPTQENGVIGRGLNFDGDDRYFNNTEMENVGGTPDFTIMFWVNVNATGSEEFFWTTSETYGAIDTTCRLDGGATITCWSRTSTFTSVSTSVGVSAETWYHIAFVKDSANTNAYIYMNGILRGTDSDSDGNVPNPSDTFIFGAETIAGLKSFTGLMDEFYWYDRLLSGSEINISYQMGNVSNPVTERVKLSALGPEQLSSPPPPTVANLSSRNVSINDTNILIGTLSTDAVLLSAQLRNDGGTLDSACIATNETGVWANKTCRKVQVVANFSGINALHNDRIFINTTGFPSGFWVAEAGFGNEWHYFNGTNETSMGSSDLVNGFMTVNITNDSTGTPEYFFESDEGASWETYTYDEPARDFTKVWEEDNPPNNIYCKMFNETTNQAHRICWDFSSNDTKHYNWDGTILYHDYSFDGYSSRPVLRYRNSSWDQPITDIWYLNNSDFRTGQKDPPMQIFRVTLTPATNGTTITRTINITNASIPANMSVADWDHFEEDGVDYWVLYDDGCWVVGTCGTNYIWIIGDVNNTWQWANFSWSNHSITDEIGVGARIYYNSTDGTENVTEVMEFSISKNPPSITANLAYTSPSNITIASTITSGDIGANFSIYVNDTIYNSTLISSLPTTLTNTTELVFGLYNFSTVYNGTENYSLTMIENLTYVEGFSVNDSETGDMITTFQMIVVETEESYSTTNGIINVHLAEFLTGANTLRFIATGYNSTEYAETFASTTLINKTYSLVPASINITVYDAADAALGVLTSLTFNVTITNTTNATTWYDQTIFFQYVNATPIGDVTIDISSYGYQPRQYYRTIDTNIANEFTAYLLKTADALYVRFHILTVDGVAIVGASVTGQRFLDDSWQTVEERTTDAAGVAALSLAPFANYRISVSASGYVPQTQTIQPSANDYYFYMQSTSNITYHTLFEDITWSLIPTDPTIMPNVSYTFQFDINNTNNTFEWFSMNITYNETTPVYFQNDTTSSGGGNLTHELNNTVNHAGNYTVIVRFKKTGWDEWNYTSVYQLRDIIVGPAAETNIWAFLTAIQASGMSPLFLNLLAIFAAFFGAGIASRMGISGGGWIALIILTVFTVVGWFDWRMMLLTGMGMLAVLFETSKVSR